MFHRQAPDDRPALELAYTALRPQRAQRLPSASLRSAAEAQTLPGERVPPRIKLVSAADLTWLPALADLLIDSVHQGASLGFIAPMSRYAALDYWHGVFARLGPRHHLWIACEDSERSQLLGCVQLALCQQPSAAHRAEVLGLMVHSRSRGLGIASRLMSRLECSALQQGRKLLVLDTPTGSQAEAVYAHLGWLRAGEVPECDSSADGLLHGTSRYYKRLSMPS